MIMTLNLNRSWDIYWCYSWWSVGDRPEIKKPLLFKVKEEAVQII